MLVPSGESTIRVFAKVACAAVVLLIGACGDNSGGDGGTAGTQGSAEVGGEDESGESSSEDGESMPIPARGLRISGVEANQGIGVNIGVGNEWIDAGSRIAPLIAGRDTLIRVYWDFDEDWVPREMEARLTLYPPEGEPVTKYARTHVELESTPKFIDRSFYFSVAQEEALVGLKYQVSLWEVDASMQDVPEQAAEPINPSSGPEWIGFEDGAMQLKIHIVPFISDWNGCSRIPDDSEDTRKAFERRMFQRNAVHEVEITWEDPATMTQAPTSFTQLFPTLDDRRVANGLLPNVYYYGLIDPCVNDLDGAGGLAMTITGDSMEAGFQRISAGLSQGADWSATTLVHEVGHTQGLMHAYCEASPNQGADPSYPHEDAKIGVWGFGIRDFTIRDPDTSRDYMSYCYSGSWASDYHWWKTLTRIRILTSWETGDYVVPPTATQPILVSLVDSKGQVVSYVTEGGIEDDFGDSQLVEIETLAGSLSLSGQSRMLPDGDGRVVIAPWPGLDAEPLELLLPGLGRAQGAALDGLR